MQKWIARGILGVFVGFLLGVMVRAMVVTITRIVADPRILIYTPIPAAVLVSALLLLQWATRNAKLGD